MSTLTLKGNMLFPDGVIRQGLLEINGRKIISVKPLVKGVKIPSDAKGFPDNYTISPGFIDIQVNGGFGHDLTANPERVEDVAKSWPKFGVTSFLPTVITSPLENLTKAVDYAKDAMRRGSGSGANILGLHFEGPYITPSKGGAHNKKYMRNPSKSDTSIFDPSVVKLVTLAPELPGCLDFIKALTSKGIVVGMGHTEASYEETLKAVEYGASWGTHLFNGMVELTHRKPGIVGALLTSEKLRFGLIADGIHVHPAICKLANLAKHANGITLISDAIGATGMPPGEYNLGDLKIIVDGTSSRLVGGGLAGSILTLDRAVSNMVNFEACTLAEALIMASATPAETLNIRTKGKLQKDFDADLVVLDGDLNVFMTVVNGDIVYKRQSTDKKKLT